MHLGYPKATQRDCLFLCDQAILQLLREVAYFGAIRLQNSYPERLPISMQLGYPKATLRGCLFLCDQAIIQLIRVVAYLCTIRLLNSYLERFPTSVRLGYSIVLMRSWLFLCDQAILSNVEKLPIFRTNRVYYYFAEKQPISVQIGHAVVMKRRCLFLCEQIEIPVVKKPMFVFRQHFYRGLVLVQIYRVLICQSPVCCSPELVYTAHSKVSSTQLHILYIGIILQLCMSISDKIILCVFTTHPD